MPGSRDLKFLLVSAAGLLLLPLALRGAAAIHPIPNLQPTYLPAIEGARVRLPFDGSRVDDLRGMQPDVVVIGDSMAGTRIEPGEFTRVSGRSIAPLLYAGSGPAWWYLALKNWVIASGITRRRSSSSLSRHQPHGRAVPARRRMVARHGGALAREDELNAVVARRHGNLFYEVRAGVERAYAGEVRRWVDPAVNEWPAQLMFPYARRPRAAFLQAVPARVGVDHLRPMDAADMQATEDREADFSGLIDKSVLPLMLRDARQAGLRLVFMRTCSGGRPAMRRRPPHRHCSATCARCARLHPRAWRAAVRRHRRSG